MTLLSSPQLNRVLSFICSFNPFSPNPGRREKINLNFSFHTFLCVVPQGFMKALKAFIKLFEALQRSVKMKI